MMKRLLGSCFALRETGSFTKPMALVLKATQKAARNQQPEKAANTCQSIGPTYLRTGLGLSLSYDVVTKGQGGTLQVESVERDGTEFIIILPIT